MIYREGRNKMTDYSQFEASTKSGINPDIKRIRKMDEIVGVVLNQRRESKIKCVICIILAVAVFRVKVYLTIIFGLLALFYLWRGTGKIADTYLREIYEEGLLVPGLIVRTQPMAVMAIANIIARGEADTINACYNLEVKNLDGARGELYEKIPCSCFVRYEEGLYHSAFFPHPLQWGTGSQDEINAALMQAEKDNKENIQDEWEVIKKISGMFPSLKNGEMVLLDENYLPFGTKHSEDSGYTPLNLETPLNKNFGMPPAGQYKKTGQKDTEESDVVYITDDIPGKDIYNKMIKLALPNNVYPYISGQCKYGPVIMADNTGLFTYIGDKNEFLEHVHNSNIPLNEGEYPLIYQKFLVTTRGCYQNGKLVPWNQIKFSVKFNSINGIKLYINNEKFAEFSIQADSYKNMENMSAMELQMVLHNEALHILEFLQSLESLQ